MKKYVLKLYMIVSFIIVMVSIELTQDFSTANMTNYVISLIGTFALIFFLYIKLYKVIEDRLK